GADNRRALDHALTIFTAVVAVTEIGVVAVGVARAFTAYGVRNTRTRFLIAAVHRAREAVVARSRLSSTDPSCTAVVHRAVGLVIAGARRALGLAHSGARLTSIGAACLTEI